MGFVDFFDLSVLDKNKELPVKNLLRINHLADYDFIGDLKLSIYEKDELINIIRSFVDEDIDTIELQGIALEKDAPITFGPKSFTLGTLFDIYLDTKCRAYLVLFDDEGNATYKKVKFNNSFCFFVNTLVGIITDRYTPFEVRDLMEDVVNGENKEALVDIIIETMRIYNVNKNGGLIRDPDITQ